MLKTSADIVSKRLGVLSYRWLLLLTWQHNLTCSHALTVLVMSEFILTS